MTVMAYIFLIVMMTPGMPSNGSTWSGNTP